MKRRDYRGHMEQIHGFTRFMVQRRKLTVILATLVALVAVMSSYALWQKISVPSPGEKIIIQSRTAHLLDATFKIAYINDEGDQYLGTGELTTKPHRTEEILQSVNTYPLIMQADILDYATQADYYKDTLINPDQHGWGKLRGFPSGFETTILPLIYQRLSDATLIGTEQVNGMTVWHIYGTLTAPDEFYTNTTDTAQIDVYLRQDSYLPVKLLVHVTGGVMEDDMFEFTAFNTGVSIKLPKVG